jgi:hyperosmotically inducible periplasmic protein
MKFRIIGIVLAFFVLAGACLAKQEPVTDDSLYNQVKIKLAGDQVVKGGGLDVDVKQGVVTLSGSVETLQQKERAEKLVKKMKGVKQVVNKITLRK